MRASLLSLDSATYSTPLLSSYASVMGENRPLSAYTCTVLPFAV